MHDQQILSLLRALACCALMPGIAAPAQQAQSPSYELVSAVKPSHAPDSHLRIRMDVDAIDIEDASLRDLLANTYGIRTTLIVNLPRWAESSHFDIRAKILSDDPTFLQHITRAQRREIFQQLLSDRFGVALHRETRSLPTYELVRIGAGPSLIENPPPQPSDKPEPIKPGHNGRGNTSVLGTSIDATGVRIGDLSSTLGRLLDRTIVDKTGLTSFYDINLTWKDERSDPADPTRESGPSLFTALQEQLGLKLIPSRGPVEVLVVDKASPPTED